jgi:hypothetical protein
MDPASFAAGICAGLVLGFIFGVFVRNLKD